MKSQFYAFSQSGNNSTQSLAVTSSCQRIHVTAGNQVRITNIGTQTVFVETSVKSGSLPTATVNDSFPVLPGYTEIFGIYIDGTELSGYVAVVAASTGSTIYVTPGEGI